MNTDELAVGYIDDAFSDGAMRVVAKYPCFFAIQGRERFGGLFLEWFEANEFALGAIWQTNDPSMIDYFVFVIHLIIQLLTMKMNGDR